MRKLKLKLNLSNKNVYWNSLKYRIEFGLGQTNLFKLHSQFKVLYKNNLLFFSFFLKNMLNEFKVSYKNNLLILSFYFLFFIFPFKFSKMKELNIIDNNVAWRYWELKYVFIRDTWKFMGTYSEVLCIKDRKEMKKSWLIYMGFQSGIFSFWH